jgi:signal recognition particle receptor subunit alpha
VDNIKTIFVSLYGEQLKKPNTTIIECTKFDEYFDQQLQELDRTSARGATVTSSNVEPPVDEELATLPPGAGPPSAPGLTYRGRALNNGTQLEVTSTESTPIQTPITSRPSTPGGSNLVVAKAGPAAKLSRRAKKAKNTTAASSGDERSSSTKGKKDGAKGPKKGRKWDADGYADEEDDVQLDYSAQAHATTDSENETTARSSAVEQIDSSTWGSTTKGKFILKDLGDEVHDILASAKADQAMNSKKESSSGTGGLLGTGINAVSGLFRNVIGGKTLTKEDLAKAMKGMEEHLLQKNVAREAAVRLCEGVEKELVGVKTGNFESINARIQTAMEASLTKMLTPTSSLDLLREIDAVTTPPATSLRTARPYVISIVGVNGVGKSTNLSKICFFLLQNKYKVLIAAGDTFRSGAVEQLAVHVRNLKELTAREGGTVDIYQKGYGKDAATVAKDAVAHAAVEGYDVVLIDTAGRRHNDQRLMSSLEKFAKFAQPDKILMVGEVCFPITTPSHPSFF